RQVGAAAVTMTRGNQREFARQKNMKKQRDSVMGKRLDDGLSAATPKERDSEIMQQKQKKANEKKEEPK
ncbi:small EDRK-rich factor 2, partial [Sigmodon hispidus]